MNYLNSKIFKRILYITIASISIFLLFFVAYKASVTSFIHDESFTYLNYVHLKFIHILSFKNSNINNHILNSILIKYSEILFGTSELTLRLPNILALFVYLVFTFLILKRYKLILLLPLFIFMTFNPFLLDFFGLTRGYGLSIGLMITSLYFLISYFEDKEKNSKLIAFNLSALLAALANFTLLNFYVAGLVTFNAIILLDYIFNKEGRKIKFNLLKKNKVNIISVFISTIVLFEPVRRLAKISVSSYGGGSLIDTFSSQVYNTFYNIGISKNHCFFLTYSIIFILIANLTIITINIARQNEQFIKQFKGLIISNLIIVIILLEIIVQHFLFNYDYFKDRFALFLYPLVVLNFSYLIYYILTTRIKYIAIAFCFLSILPFSKNLYNNLNLKSYKDWRYDMNTKKMLAELDNHLKETNYNKTQIQLGINWLFEPTINFYRTTKNMEWLKPVDREGLKKDDDFNYLFDDELKFNEEIIFTGEMTNSSRKTILIKVNKK